MSKKLLSDLKKILKKTCSIAVLGRTLLIVGISLSLMLSFYWDLGIQPFKIKEIWTLDTGLVVISLAPEFLLALVGILVFCVGYQLYARKKWGGEAKISSIESGTELVVKFISVVCIGMAGIWYTYTQFSTAGIWDYHIPNVVKVATGSVALQVNTILALLLLVILVIEIRIRYE